MTARAEPSVPSPQQAAGRSRREEPGRFRRALHRLTAREEVLEAEELQDEAVQVGATAIAACPLGGQVCVAGTVRAVVLRPLAGVPTL